MTSFLFLIQALLDKQSSRSPEKEELTALSDALTSHLPDGNPDVEHLRRQLSELNTTWSDMSDRLEQQQADLALAHNLAKSYEKATQKLLPWVPGTLEHLKGLGPPPAEPEAVEARKSMIEVTGYSRSVGRNLLVQCTIGLQAPY